MTLEAAVAAVEVEAAAAAAAAGSGKGKSANTGRHSQCTWATCRGRLPGARSRTTCLQLAPWYITRTL